MSYICTSVTKHFQLYFEVTNTTGPIILGRTQAKAMGYVKFPNIQHPHTFTTHSTTFKRICTDKTHLPETAIDTHPQIQLTKCLDTKVSQPEQPKQSSVYQLMKQECPKIWNTDSTKFNCKVHKLPITKDYILREYNDVFKGIGILPARTYHIRLKEQYRLVQHPQSQSQ